MTHWTDEQADVAFARYAGEPPQVADPKAVLLAFVGASRKAGRALLTLEQDSANKTATVEALNERIATLEAEQLRAGDLLRACRLERDEARLRLADALRERDNLESSRNHAFDVAQRMISERDAARRELEALKEQLK